MLNIYRKKIWKFIFTPFALILSLWLKNPVSMVAAILAQLISWNIKNQSIKCIQGHLLDIIFQIPCASHCFPIYNALIDWRSSYMCIKSFVNVFLVGKQWEAHRATVAGEAVLTSKFTGSEMEIPWFSNGKEKKKVRKWSVKNAPKPGWYILYKMKYIHNFIYLCNNIQGGQLNMARFFWYLGKCDLSSVYMYSSVDWTWHFLQSTRITRFNWSP